MDTIFGISHAVRAARSILKGVPVAAGYFVTNRCNYRCEFCNYPSFNTDRSRELTPDQAEAMFQNLARAGVVMLSVIGGEPFLRKDAVEVLRRAAKRLLVQVTTNGTYISEEMAEAIYAAGVYQVNVSLDSADKEVHNKGRRSPKAYDRAIAAIERLRDAHRIAADQRVCIESVLSGRNYAEAEDIVDLAGRLGVHVVFQPFSAGHAGEGAADMDLRGADPTKALLALKARSPHLDNPPDMINRLTPYFATGSAPDCLAGRSYVHVDAYGNLLRCEEHRKHYGNLPYMTNAAVRRAFRCIQADTEEDGCSSCYLRTRGETEPLYRGGPKELVRAARDMFGVDLPGAVPLILAAPGAKGALASGLDNALRFRDHPLVDEMLTRGGSAARWLSRTASRRGAA